ncbi:aldo/keto reductase [Aggregatibacter actinomycetemcomitans serotype e str. SC1083]|uniref:Aldo/keto reductase n=1 Tax=Aggregatibacter actinomycetemcomitans serotype e str. SC1083 TaxID=907488 RepID=G4ABB1_AGGAC|nr:aldo/keto reductase [Aggregatibacter actinomycetemcomitans]KYK75190.1 hypothetical protein SA3096_03660 [Aggregatibacter actinomycetemcomitans serotype e str. SA3096]KYK77941.1 hypothetical protein SC936_09855 [Aggregatibacter actinomycetemcomitans serotype e str. SC936]KYK94571.1 hypothetical protein ANH9776_07030 [Aggregatibacter actinomycetemcomitans serotype e str. ANH9776]EGY32452.1 aldo/keto reductase [Aggregatibacter actinomycetemcomitans serotype e str. SC1083]TYB21379.1 aldo/keto r
MINQSKRNLLKTGGLTALALGLGGTAMAKQAVKNSPTFTNNKLPGQRKLGNLTVSSIGLGCQELGQNMYGVPQPSREQGVRIIRRAFDHGVTFFDTAEAYGPFESECVVGEGLKGIRDHVVLATKFGWDIDQQRGSAQAN